MARSPAQKEFRGIRSCWKMWDGSSVANGFPRGGGNAVSSRYSSRTPCFSPSLTLSVWRWKWMETKHSSPLIRHEVTETWSCYIKPWDLRYSPKAGRIQQDTHFLVTWYGSVKRKPRHLKLWSCVLWLWEFSPHRANPLPTCRQSLNCGHEPTANGSPNCCKAVLGRDIRSSARVLSFNAELPPLRRRLGERLES